MSFQPIRDGGLDYLPCHYGTRKPLFRGPERTVTKRSILSLGGTQTFGKFVAEPWPERLERSLGRPVVNLGSVNASADLYLGTPHLVDMANAADAVVLEICGAAALSNRFFNVHPLRNDRFLTASSTLKSIYRDVDFTDFAFIRHMLGHLAKTDAKRFGTVVAELQKSWITRMQQLLARIDRPVIGLWLADEAPPQKLCPDTLSPDPLFVTAPMLHAIESGFAAIVQVTPGAQARSLDVPGRIFHQLDMSAANTVFPACIHQEVANTLVPVLEKHLTPAG
jgi:hypothetical protein